MIKLSTQNFVNNELDIEPTATEKIANFEVTFDSLVNETIVFKTFYNKHSVAGFKIRLKRRSHPILINTYLPCMMLLLISFIGFFIPVEMIPGRMALLVTIFLMLVNISSSEKTDGPNVIDINKIPNDSSDDATDTTHYRTTKTLRSSPSSRAWGSE